MSDAPSGTYVSWQLSRECSKAVREWCTRVGVRAPLAVGEHHCTIMYSPRMAVSPEMHGDRPLPRPWHLAGYAATSVDNPALRTDVLGPRHKPGALVVILHSPVMASRHRWWRDEHYLQSTYASYLPHVTLSYAFDRQDPVVMLDIIRRPLPVPLHFDTERVKWCNE